MAIKFTDGPPKASPQKERLVAGNKALSRVLNQVAEGTIKAPEPKRGRKPDPNAKKLLTLRIDPDVIEHFKSSGAGWQSRMNEALRKAAGL